MDITFTSYRIDRHLENNILHPIQEVVINNLEDRDIKNIKKTLYSLALH